MTINKKLTCEIDGIIIYKENYSNDESMRQLLDDYKSSQGIDFNSLMGSFRVRLFNEDDNEVIFFGDNSGSMCFYYNNDKFSDSLLDLPAKKIPDFDGIAQFIMFGCIYGYKTIISGVYQTDPNKFYVLSNNRIEEKSKNLLGFEELKHNTLEEIINKYIKATHNRKKISIITGGMDSRAILAHLLNKNQIIELCITGKPEHADVRVAKQISETVGLPLHTFGELPDADDKDFIRNSFIASDGVHGVLGRFRLYNKSKHLKSMGFDVIFGGVAGEIYKNCFIRQDFPFYFGKPDLKKLYKSAILANDFSIDIFRESMRKSISNAENIILEELFFSKQKTKNKFMIYTDIGYSILQRQMITLTNSGSKSLIPLFPLMERSLVAYIYNRNPYTNEFSYFQRNQVSTFYPNIKNINTDQGENCSDNLTLISKEIIKKIPAYLKKRLMRNSVKKQNEGRIDEVFYVGLRSKEYKDAIAICKKAGILKEETDEDTIPPIIADRLMTLGMVFAG